MPTSRIFVNVNTDKPLEEVAQAVAAAVGGKEGNRVSIINQRGGLSKDEGVVTEFFESEGTEPLATETKFRIKG